MDRRPDGGIVVSLPVVNRAAFRSWVVDLLDHAEVLSPPELRVDMVAWLDAVAGGFATERGPSAPPRNGESEQG